MNNNPLPNEDTIAAIASAQGSGGVAVIRISGKNSVNIIKEIFSPSSTSLNTSDMQTHKLYHGSIIDPSNKRIIDDVLCVIMKSPNSYTGEDVAEIHSHGGYIVPKKICELIYSTGARPANAGEFSLRAFLNGKMDLTQAESVTDIVNAQTDEGLKQAELQLEGLLSDTIHVFRDILVDLLAEIEAQVDFPEEDIDPIVKDHIIQRTTTLISDIESLFNSYESGRMLKYGVHTTILGKPNVGKSSLLNALLMKDRAIVSPHPGTTRDFIEETIDLHGIPLRITDTAGMRATADEIEIIGVNIAKKKSDEAELIIAVIDGSSELTEDDFKVLDIAKNKISVLIINKSDMPQKVSKSSLIEYISPTRIVNTSAKTRRGIEELKEIIRNTLLSNENKSEAGEIVLTELRHKIALEKSKESIHSFLSALKLSESPEFLAVDLRSALDYLGEITGEVTTEDILGKIFSKFCVGK